MRHQLREPLTQSPVSYLVVVLNADDKPISGQVRGWASVATATKRRVPSVIHEAAGENLRDGADAAKILKVALPFASQRRMHRVVKIVGPLCIQPVTSSIPALDVSGIIGIAFRDEMYPPP